MRYNTFEGFPDVQPQELNSWQPGWNDEGSELHREAHAVVFAQESYHVPATED